MNVTNIICDYRNIQNLVIDRSGFQLTSLVKQTESGDPAMVLSHQDVY